MTILTAMAADRMQATDPASNQQLLRLQTIVEKAAQQSHSTSLLAQMAAVQAAVVLLCQTDSCTKFRGMVPSP